MEDTLFNRAYYAATKQFDDLAARVSFGWRVQTVLPIAMTKKYRKYVNFDAGSLHVALLAAVVNVRGSYRTTPKALRAAFDEEFRRQLAVTVDPGELRFRQ